MLVNTCGISKGPANFYILLSMLSVFKQYTYFICYFLINTCALEAELQNAFNHFYKLVFMCNLVVMIG